MKKDTTTLAAYLSKLRGIIEEVRSESIFGDGLPDDLLEERRYRYAKIQYFKVLAHLESAILTAELAHQFAVDADAIQR